MFGTRSGTQQDLAYSLQAAYARSQVLRFRDNTVLWEQIKPMLKKIALLILAVLLMLIGIWKFSRSRQLQLVGELIYHVETVDSLVALTFDDGPTPEYTDAILTQLDTGHARATFFVTGQELDRFPEEGRKLVDAGHQLGNHSYTHAQMVLKGPSFISSELDRTNQAIRQSGYDGEILFRPPYCKKLIILPWILSQRGMRSITWDIEPESYPEVGASASDIVEHVMERVQPGSIILLHLMYPRREESRKALPILIDSLKSKGYSLVTMNELLEHS